MSDCTFFFFSSTKLSNGNRGWLKTENLPVYQGKGKKKWVVLERLKNIHFKCFYFNITITMHSNLSSQL